MATEASCCVPGLGKVCFSFNGHQQPSVNVCLSGWGNPLLKNYKLIFGKKLQSTSSQSAFVPLFKLCGSSSNPAAGTKVAADLCLFSFPRCVQALIRYVSELNHAALHQHAAFTAKTTFEI